MASAPIPDHGNWKKRISNNAAAALLLFTLLHIACFVALSGVIGSGIAHFLGIAILVGLVIPALARFEARWHGDALAGLTDAELAVRFRTERVWLWLAAVIAPFLWSGVFLGLWVVLG